MIEGICKGYLSKAISEGNIFPEESCIDILSKIIDLFCKHVNEIHKLLEKKDYVEALSLAKYLCDFEGKISNEFSFIEPFYNTGRLEFKQSIDKLLSNKNKFKVYLKEALMVMREANVTVFPLKMLNFLQN